MTYKQIILNFCDAGWQLIKHPNSWIIIGAVLLISVGITGIIILKEMAMTRKQIREHGFETKKL
tara:strand:+ start:1377 stop:1568 length:192 start_codon:yes stop_codon:yes gene_type:complete